MKKIITINRQFGSGGREIAKRLADVLQIAYYDKALINQIAEKTSFSPEFIAEASETMNFQPLVFANTFASNLLSPADTIQIAQTEFIKEIAEKEDCIIVGRCANSILEDTAFKVFIYASDMDTRIERCYVKVPADQDMPRKKMEKQILAVDKQRAKYHSFTTGQEWFDMNNYDLCIDTSKMGVKKAVELIVCGYKLYFAE
ncbi:cytidylate kinase-like family protein [Chakrabartyella piscis]|uniref:cytidylate kinase-like family protein n=1 Tax=Chakrabartyella piscis TaxID=2918914 RepID=UPI0029584970|nr:cytidylate kinase-like family protein [Chakrabartyella piscis]